MAIHRASLLTWSAIHLGEDRSVVLFCKTMSLMSDGLMSTGWGKFSSTLLPAASLAFIATMSDYKESPSDEGMLNHLKLPRLRNMGSRFDCSSELLS